LAATTGTEERPSTKPFAAWLQEQRNGGLHAELSERLAELVSACLEHGKAGTLTLSVKVAPNKDGVTVTIFDDVKAKAPADRGAAIFYADDHGNVSRRDPRQPELPLKPIESMSPRERTGTED
jgi:hypothetical protein